MTAYFVWNPSLETHEPVAVRAFVTLGELAYIGKGTDAFIAGCLEAAKVSGEIARWTLTRYRTQYFTEYPEGDDWEDRWQPTWRIHAEYHGLAELTGDSSDGQYPCDAVDDSWSRKTSTVRAPEARCLVLVDFVSRDTLEAARAQVAGQAVHTTVGRSMNHYWQLEVDLGDRDEAFYSGGDELAREVIAACRAQGGFAHYQNAVAARLAARR